MTKHIYCLILKKREKKGKKDKDIIPMFKTTVNSYFILVKNKYLGLIEILDYTGVN